MLGIGPRQLDAKAGVQKVSAIVPHLGGHLDGEESAKFVTGIHMYVSLKFLRNRREIQRGWPKLAQLRQAGLSAAMRGHGYLNTDL